MDLQDIWQEHRRFILGCFIGLLAFFVVRGIMGSVLDTEGFGGCNFPERHAYV